MSLPEITDEDRAVAAEAYRLYHLPTTPMNDDARATFADAFRAGHAHALANHPDTRRMDWLDQCGWVGWSRSRSPDDETARTKIDRDMEGGQ